MNNKKNKSSKNYFKEYDSLKRFISYFYQIDSAIKTKPETILEIGIGNKTVSNYLKQAGFQITTCDFDKTLRPDIVADIRKLPFKANSFDTILACQILEHIPFKDVGSALKELRRVSKKNVIISTIYHYPYLENIFKITLPFFERQIRFVIKVPFLSRINRPKQSKEHYWEIGRKNYSKQRVRSLIKKYFKIRKEFKPILNSNRYFFVLEK